MNPIGNTLSVYDRPYLYPKQEKAIFSGKRWSLCEASTKSGKTVGAIVRIIEAALQGTFGQNFWWVAPVSNQARIAFNRVKLNLTAGTFTARESPEPSITMITGAVISFKSADNADSLYGEDVFGAVIDEASRAKVDAWYAIRSTLTATAGWAVVIGNVKGRRNWFFEWCRRTEAGKDPNAAFQRITWRDAVDAKVLDIEEIDDARRNLPEQVFNELYEAEASDDGGNPFGLNYIAACINEALSSNPPVAFGIDLAKKQDYLVIIGLDEAAQVCRFERWRGVPWRDSIVRIHNLVGEDTPALVDSTGVGDPVLEELQDGYGNFSGINFTNVSKQRLMEGLSVSIQSHEIGYPEGAIVHELQTFEYVEKGGRVFYGTQEGYNDDCVCALALARQAWATSAPGINLMNFMATETKRIAEKKTEPEAPNNRPWRQFEDSLAEQIDNELTELYEKTLATLTPKVERHCFACGRIVDSRSRVTDGEFVWHQECTGIANRVREFA